MTNGSSTDKPLSAVERKEFEESRRSLLHVYHSYGQTHAGYLIAIIIGSLTLISQWGTFFIFDGKPNPVATIIFFAILSAAIGAGFHIAGRVVYWTTCAGLILGFSIESAIKLFREFYSEEKITPEANPPKTLILELAAIKFLEKNAGRKFYFDAPKRIPLTTRIAAMNKGILFAYTFVLSLICFSLFMFFLIVLQLL